MINLVDYYNENFPINTNSSYDLGYYCNIQKYPRKWIELQKDLVFMDDKQIINEWKNILYPANDNRVQDIEYKNAKYYYISYYLWNEKYIIKEYPTELESTRGREKFSDGILYSETARIYGRDYKNEVKWADRRKLIDSLKIVKIATKISIKPKIEKLITDISTRGADFTAMAIDEKLENIRNAYEYLIFQKGGFDKVDYPSVFMDLIDEFNLKEYSKKLHCFRHGNPDAVKERTKYTDEEKQYMIEFGIIVLNKLH